MDPILALISTSGEDAVLKTPAAAAGYNPGASPDYTPNADGSLPLRGVPETKLAYEVGAAAAFTFSCTAKPPGLRNNDSQLQWAGETWTVVKHRMRHWMGRINGCTLFLEQ